MSGHNHDIQNLKVAFWLNLCFTFIELLGGLFVNSVAIVSDAIHDFGDCMALGMAWYFQKLGHKGRTTNYNYGFQRFSLLGATLSAMILIAGSAVILSETVTRFFDPEMPNTNGMLLLAFLGVAVNGVAAYRIKSGKSLNERVISLHLLEDVLGWLAVLFGGLVMSFWEIPIIDPILSLCISAYVLFSALKMLRKTVRIFLQRAPDNANLTSLTSPILQLEGVKDVHDVRVWSMDGVQHIMSFHLVLQRTFDPEQAEKLKRSVRESLKKKNINHVTIELEDPIENCTSIDSSD